MMQRALLALALVASCGGDDGANPTDSTITRPSIGTSPTNLCDQIAQVACYDMFRCCSYGDIEQQLQVDRAGPTECLNDMKKRCQRRFAPELAALAANRVQFDSSVMDTCLGSLVAPDNLCASLDIALPWTQACMGSAWVGTVASGGQCFYTFECAGVGSSYCAPDQTCKPLPTEGMPCTPVCADGYACVMGGCHLEAGAGGDCSVVPCGKDLYCDTSATTATCQPLQGNGQRCFGSPSCQSGDCSVGACMDTGQLCYRDQACSMHCANNPGSFCVVSGNCSTGHCTLNTSKICLSSSECLANEGTCFFPVECVHTPCVGDIICVGHPVTVDFCMGALTALQAI